MSGVKLKQLLAKLCFTEFRELAHEAGLRFSQQGGNRLAALLSSVVRCDATAIPVLGRVVRVLR